MRSPLGRLWLRVRERILRLLRAVAPDELDISWVTETLAVGSRFQPEDVARLAHSGFQAVVDVRAEACDDRDLMARHGIALLHLPTPDAHALSGADLRVGVEWIRAQMDEGRKVLVHCTAGVGRAPLLTCAVLTSMGYSARDAMDLVRKRRWRAAPNDRQLAALLEFEASCRPTSPTLCGSPPPPA
jgi:protein tyrosine phosphatase (PTP) superfamily phosphohydrolase (DUF442 family)